MHADARAFHDGMARTHTEALDSVTVVRRNHGQTRAALDVELKRAITGAGIGPLSQKLSLKTEPNSRRMSRSEPLPHSFAFGRNLLNKEYASNALDFRPSSGLIR